MSDPLHIYVDEAGDPTLFGGKRVDFESKAVPPKKKKAEK